MKAVHLIQKDLNLRPKPKEGGGGMLQSGYWKISLRKAYALIGAKIFFHEHQLAPSLFGGTITDFEIKDDEPWKGRVVFIFKPEIKCIGFKTDRDGWAAEKKYVY